MPSRLTLSKLTGASIVWLFLVFAGGHNIIRCHHPQDLFCVGPRRIHLSSARALRSNVASALQSVISNEVVRPLLEPILHPSRWRIRALGLSTTVGHPLFFVIWTKFLPQPYENLFLRLLMSSLGLSLLLYRPFSANPPGRMPAVLFTAIFWITLPVFFSWMYLCNRGNTVWLASLAAMFLIYYHLTDWRIATLGSVSGGLVAWLAFDAFGPSMPPMPFDQLATNCVVLAFSWYMALALGLSSSNLRREQINYTLATIGIMAHELRTPLATMSLIGDAMKAEAPVCPDESRQKLERLATRMHTLVRNMNRQIDTQIANARLLRLPTHKESVSAGELVTDALRDYPYRSPRERDGVVLQIRRDFKFAGSRALFLQVINNLVKNALRSLASASTVVQPGDLLIEVGTLHDRGRIVLTDRGVGIAPELLDQIFEPFFSTDHGAGHGLGLAFCKRVIQSANGSIRVKSESARGAIFTIELPLLG
ncbi:MAG: HAMP domain-containing histidine kinase [Ramlibacter sp.]|nr:HAMP domain-containing histidine kinase [Ramlibacter sp.]